MAKKSMLDIQGDAHTVESLEKIIAQMKDPVESKFVVSLLKGHDDMIKGASDLTSCVIGFKKDLANLDRRLSIMETKEKLISGVASKLGMAIIGASLAVGGGIAVYFLTRP